MTSHTIDELTSCILDFQANMIRVTFRKKNTVVEPEAEPSHAISLNMIWAASNLESSNGTKWRRLGFRSENIPQEFSEVGVLGLDCLVHGTPDTPLTYITDLFGRDILHTVIQHHLRRSSRSN